MEPSNKNNAQKKAEQVADAFVDESSFKTDPQGSYTGKTIQKAERPVQDVDDL